MFRVTSRTCFAVCWILILLPFLSLFSCSRGPEEIAVTSVSLNQATAEMNIGETVQLQVSIAPTNATDKTVLWASSKQSVATVSSEGVVAAVSSGNSTITATVGGKSATCQVTVLKGFVAVSSVSLNTSKVTLTEGETTTLTATVHPDDATDKSVVWSSSASDIASVSNGVVTAHKAGTATITAKAGDKSAQCTVEVKSMVIAVTSITLNKSKLPLIEGESETLVATVKPDNATNKTVTWTSSDVSIASVSGSGKVIAIKEGTTVITAQAGDKQAVCVVEVSKMVIPVTAITLNKNTLALEKGKYETLVATVSPLNATDKTVTWSSSNTQVVSVDQNGLVIALASGSALITAKAGDKTATCSVTVTVPVESITLSDATLTLVEEQSATLMATIYPADATDKTVTWSSNNVAVATVNNGKVTAIKAGTATITATAGNKTATCAVTVNKKYIDVTSITLNKTTLPLTKGDSEILEATVNPSDATDKTVTWTTSNASVASVDQNGKVNAVGGGSATITAKAGDKTATCVVTVTVPVESITLDKTTLALFKGQDATLTATVNPVDATDKTVTWASSNTSVVTVNNGKVTAVAAGNATITAKAGNKTATCSVSVTVPVSGVSVSPSSMTLTQGEKQQLTATISPADATNKAVSWSSSSASIATVDANGMVSAINPGTTQITVTTQDGGYKATCSVTVKEYPKATSLSLSVDSFEAFIGQSYPITVVAAPSDAVCEYEWASSDTRVATINGTTSQASIQTKDYGTTTVMVKEKRSGLTKSISVSTIVTDFAWNMETAKTYNGYPLVVVHLNEKAQLNYTCTPASATHIFDDLSQFTFYENSQTVGTPVNISVSDSGEVKGLKIGITGIEAKGRLRTNGTARIYIRVIDNGNTEPIDDDDNEHGWD